jgi:hypothetical protein
VAVLNTSKSGLQNLLTAILSVANQDQNMALPAYIFSSFVNTATSFLLDKCVELYPTSPQLIDIIDPYVKISCIPMQGGSITLPIDYRNILGSPSIIARQDNKGECGQEVPITTPQQFLAATLIGGCSRRPITIVPQSEYDYLTTSKYKKPTFWNPIAFNSGGKKLTICPGSLSKVYVMYTIKEEIYNFGYIMNPDDTYIQDPNTTVDTLWTNAAFVPLFKALNHLYAAYSRDKQFSDWAQILSQLSIV